MYKLRMFTNCSIKDEYKPAFIVKEGFEFNSVNKQHKTANAYNLLRKRLLTVLDTPIYKITKSD
jgi:hypothetical protein